MKHQALPSATLIRRLSAAIYDGLLLAALLIAAGGVAVAVNGGEAVDTGNPFFQLWLLAVPSSFYIWFWTHGGQTLGMRAWRMRVITDNGQPITFARACLRMPLAILSWVSLIGLLWCLVDDRGHAAHDRLSRSMVVVEPKG